MISYLYASLVLIGVVIHVSTLAPLRRLIAVLPAGSLRNKWLAMTGLVFIFIAGYLGYIVMLWGQQTEWRELLIPGIFLFGAIFVWLTIGVSLQTAADLRRIDDELVRKEKLAVLRQVADTVGHELRNPLGVMNNSVYFLQTVLADADEPTREYLGIIKDEIANADRIVSDLLDAVRTKPPRPASVNVAEVIGQTLGKCDIPASVIVKLDVPQHLPLVRVDPMHLHQVLWNLVTNAVEAMPEGGTLEIRAVEDQQLLRISIKDSGSGIAPEQQTKLFQPLFTTKARRVGLGLVVVKNLTQANGGTVKAESAPGKGSMFTVTLPCGS